MEAEAPTATRGLRSTWRTSSFVLVAIAFVALAAVGGGIFVAWVLTAQQVTLEGPVVLGEPTADTLGPSTPMGTAGKPVVDHALVVTEPGRYRIDLVSEDPTRYDPFVALLRNDVVVANDDDGGDGTSARIDRDLARGTYTVRVTRHRVGAFERPVGHTLTVDWAGPPS